MLEASKEELSDWFFRGNFESKHQAIKSKRVPESGKWFLNRPEYRNWLSSASPDMLYCPGLGKNPENPCLPFRLTVCCSRSRKDYSNVYSRYESVLMCE